MTQEQYYLGIDGGATKTAAVIIDSRGRECGRGLGGPGNLVIYDDATLRESLRAAVAEAIRTAQIDSDSGFAAVCAAMAGYTAERRRVEFDLLLRAEVSAERYRLEPDYVAAFWGATLGDPGIVVVAGTGAVTYGRNAHGETCREDGLGYLLGDRGSGFNLGLRVLRYTLEQMKQGKSDALTAAVMDQTGARNENAIVQWLYGNFNPQHVAAIAPAVGALAEQGDAAARYHIAAMARYLRHAVRQVRYKLWLPPDGPIYPLGGLWNLGQFFRSEFMNPQWTGDAGMKVEEDSIPGGMFHLAEPKRDAPYGAALIARDDPS